ncbi:MAG TPA: hypothetical protein PLD25_16475 [Chloroflexota bacterium]|nr:hypothetical protein [Chloroflexota bacterium]HUM71573.1 hypothetical protein [Chloroflexota bacterium]
MYPINRPHDGNQSYPKSNFVLAGVIDGKNNPVKVVAEFRADQPIPKNIGYQLEVMVCIDGFWQRPFAVPARTGPCRPRPRRISRSPKWQAFLRRQFSEKLFSYLIIFMAGCQFMVFTQLVCIGTLATGRKDTGEGGHCPLKSGKKLFGTWLVSLVSRHDYSGLKK